MVGKQALVPDVIAQRVAQACSQTGACARLWGSSCSACSRAYMPNLPQGQQAHWHAASTILPSMNQRQVLSTSLHSAKSTPLANDENRPWTLPTQPRDSNGWSQIPHLQGLLQWWDTKSTTTSDNLHRQPDEMVQQPAYKAHWQHPPLHWKPNPHDTMQQAPWP